MTWDDLTAEERQIVTLDVRRGMMTPEEYVRYEQMILEYPVPYAGIMIHELEAHCERIWAAAVADFLARRRAGSPGA